MATREELRTLSRLLEIIRERISICCSISKRLSNYEKPRLIHSFLLRLIGIRSDYEIIRSEILSVTKDTLFLVSELNNETRNENFENAHQHLNVIESLCRNCLAVNRERLNQGLAFRCLVKEEFKQNSQEEVKEENNPTFWLDEEGRIHVR